MPCFGGTQYDDGQDRVINIKNGSDVEYTNAAQGYRSNHIINSNYTWWNFLPLNLFQQFQNLANVYFLSIGVLQIIPSISTTDGIPTMYQPLAFIIAVSALRAALEDYKRHEADNKRNAAPYEVFVNEGGLFRWKEIESGSLRVGMIVKVKKDNMIPVDMIFLASEKDKGHCFIDKANLNGETKLETMESIPVTRKFAKDDDALSRFQCNLQYEMPNSKFDSISGMLTIDGHSEMIKINGKVLLMRETNLRNVEYIIGIAVYTGDDTKIQKSNNEGAKPKTKKSKIFRMVDRFLAGMLVAQVILCFIGGLVAGVSYTSSDDEWYLQNDQEGWQVGILAFFTWFILLSQMVPISLIVSAEMVKFAMSIFIQWDLDMYYAKIDKPAKVNLSTIHEDLGVVDYIFSDKTGTLTQNKMQFRYCLLLTGHSFGSQLTEIAKSVQARQSEMAKRMAGNYQPKPDPPWTDIVAQLPEEELPPKETEADKNRNCCEECCEVGCCKPCWVADEEEDDGIADHVLDANQFTERERRILLKALWHPRPDHVKPELHVRLRAALYTYMAHMALSNTVVPHPEKPGEYQYESAEELAMVQFSEFCGFTKKKDAASGRFYLEVKHYHPHSISFAEEDVTQVVKEWWVHIATFGFSSARARVTVVYQKLLDNGDSEIHCMIKGQDTTVVPLLEGITNLDGLNDLLNGLCANGLRVLVCGHAQKDVSWWKTKWSEKYTQAMDAPESKNSEGHSDNKCKGLGPCEKCNAHNLFEELEKDCKFHYLGVMGLEDQLQLLVPRTIKDCVKAGIRVWMITGDKLETAKNIGLACNLIDADMQPQFDEGKVDLEDCVDAYKTSRLIEITGQWASLVQKDLEIEKLFQIFDTNQDGLLDLHELNACLSALRCKISGENLLELHFKEKDGDVSTTATGAQGLNQSEFIKLIRSQTLSMFDAVSYDVDEGVRKYRAILADPDKTLESYPISLLVNRDAFKVLFPSKSQAKADGVSEEERNILVKKFFLLASVCKSLVFARAQPAMKKRMVVEIQKRVPKAITLAIGDGANDCDMIMAAHIGIGIAGIEGTAAVNSADYAIGSFRLLHPLLFVHGFWNYHRIADLVNFIFYKASVVALNMYMFGTVSRFSGQQFFNDEIYQFYNVVFTALPVLVVAIMDQQGTPRDVLNNTPEAYKLAKGQAFTLTKFAGWITRALLHTIVMFFIPYLAMGGEDSAILGEGKGVGLFVMSTCSFFNAVLCPTFLILFYMNSITLVHAVTIILSFSSLFLFCFLLNILVTINPDLYGVVDILLGNSVCWLAMILSVSIPLLAECVYLYIQRTYYPTFTQLLQEVNRLEDKSKADPEKSDEVQPLTRFHTQVSVNSLGAQRQNSKFREEVALKRRQSIEMVRDDRDIRASVVTAMLNFRNLTSQLYESAAQGQYQDHHQVVETKVGDDIKYPVGGPVEDSDEDENGLDARAKQGNHLFSFALAIPGENNEEIIKALASSESTFDTSSKKATKLDADNNASNDAPQIPTPMTVIPYSSSASASSGKSSVGSSSSSAASSSAVSTSNSVPPPISPISTNTKSHSNQSNNPNKQALPGTPSHVISHGPYTRTFEASNVNVNTDGVHQALESGNVGQPGGSFTIDLSPQATKLV